MAASPSAPQQHLADMAAQDEADRLARYQRAWAAYDGEGPKPLEVESDGADDNVRLDYAELIVDKGVSFLAGKGGVTFQLQPPGAAEPDADDKADAETAEAEEDDTGTDAEELQRQAAEAALDAAWPENQRHLDFHNSATNGGICGHAWLRLYEDGRVSVLDPANCTAVWNEDDVSILERYLIQWNTLDEDGMGVVRRKRIEPNDAEKPTSWTIYDEEHNDDANSWILLDETPWLHDYAPVIDTQNLPSPNTYYGRADLEPGKLDQIEQLESVASDMRRVVRFHGHPVPVATGIEANDIRHLEVAVGEMLALPGKDSGLTQLEIAELTSSLALFQELKTALFESARIPKIALGDTTNAGPTTGVALKVEYAPLIEKTETKRLTYGYLLAETARRILDLKGFHGWSVVLAWPELLPDDPAAEAQTAETELRMGIVSRQTISEKHGYEWEVEQQRIAEETPNFDSGTYTYTGGLPDGPNPPPPALTVVPPA